MDTRGTTKKLVCGLDDSEHAAAVAAVAVEFAARLGLRLCLVHSAGPDASLVGERRGVLLCRGHDLLDELIPTGVPHDRIVDLGAPRHLLAEELGAGAVLGVVGSPDHVSVRATFLGSTSKAVANGAPCPVVVVPPASAAAVTHGPAAVVVGIDGSPGAGKALRIAADLARELGSELVAMYVGPAAVPMAGAASGMPVWPPTAWEETRDAGREIVERAIDELGTELPVRIRCDIGDPAERLSSAAGDQLSAILVVGSRGHGPLRAALLGSVSSRLCASAGVPVAVVPPGADCVRLEGHRPDTAAAASA